MKTALHASLFVALILGVSCEKKHTPGEALELPGKIEAPTVIVDLEFANRVPRDADFFFAAYYDGGKMVEDARDWMLEYGSLTQGDLATVEDTEDDKTLEEKLGEAAGFLGREAFVFSGPGVGDKLTMVGDTYRELSAAWGGFVVGAMLDAFAKDGKGLDFDALSDSLSGDLLERWLAVLEKDSRLLVPSVIAGWHPEESKRDESLEAVAQLLDEGFRGKEGAMVVSFETHGVLMAGYEVKGTEVFADMIEDLRDEISQKAEEMSMGSGLSAARLERILTALEEVKFTVASGVSGGRVLIYFGDGREGFRLAETPEDSLAAKDDLRWMASPTGKRMEAAAYLSERMVGCVLPWLDNSKYWESLAKAVRAPLADERLMRDLLLGMAATSKGLARRDISAWSAAAYAGDGWSLQSRGGIVDPSIDFDAPLTMTEAVDGMKPAFRAHWVQSRDWNNLSWDKLEHMGFLFAAITTELVGVFEEEMELIPGGRGPFEKMASTAEQINKAYREEFRNGIGDEVAVFGDFLGEIPPIPGIPAETVKDFTMPRFLYARPVVDRSMLSKSGESTVAVWKDLVAYANSFADGWIPVIQPQMIESGGMMTWYAPLPFIGGDFVPGVTLNDSLWMAGSSRSLASGFAKSMQAGTGSGETGVIIEVDFEAMEIWLRELYRRGRDEAEVLASNDIERMEKSVDGVLHEFSKLKNLRYRHWLESGKPRTSIIVEFDGE